VKNFEATSFSELVRYWHLFGQICHDFRVVMKQSEMLETCVLGPMDWITCVRCEKF
jgi:hypothetical protein